MRACPALARTRSFTILTLATSLLATTPVAAQKTKSPTVAQALTLAPIQSGVTYDKPAREEIAECTIRPERNGENTSWAVRDGTGQMLRRFADSNSDNVVDTWSYYQGGLEVYRDIDANYDSKADQCRWLHTGGSRWGVDKNQDGRIDVWKQISPQEVAEEAILAIQTKDVDRFARLLISDAEAQSLGLGKDLAKQIESQRNGALETFKKLADTQEVIDAKSRFVDFGAAKPGIVPAGLDGSKKDVLVYENASALVDNGGKPEQILLGSIFRVGQGWRLTGAPRMGDSGPELASVFSVPGYTTGQSASQPTDEMQQWMEELEKLDRESSGTSGEALERSTERRAALLEKLATASSGEESMQWYSQLSDLLSAAAQSSGYEPAIRKLIELEQSEGVKDLGAKMVARIRYRRLSGAYGLALRNPEAEYQKVQEKWLADLAAFVDAFPMTEEASEAMLQLGMGQEFAGETEKAKVWYARLRQEFPRSKAGRKATGALWRLDSIGKTLPLRGQALRGGAIDLTKAPYRGITLVVHYWATWCEPCKEDMKLLAKLQLQYGGKLKVVGVNLDTVATDAKSYLASTRNGWKHLYDEQGLEGKRASEVGVMTLPLMLLVDSEGKVANRNLHGGELEEELKRVIR